MNEREIEIGVQWIVRWLRSLEMIGWRLLATSVPLTLFVVLVDMTYHTVDDSAWVAAAWGGGAWFALIALAARRRLNVGLFSRSVADRSRPGRMSPD